MSWTFFCIFKAVGLTALPWNFFLDWKRQNMTSFWRHLRATYNSLWKNFVHNVKLMLGRVQQVWWQSAQRFWRYIEKSGGEGLKIPPPTRARVNSPTQTCTTFSQLPEVAVILCKKMFYVKVVDLSTTYWMLFAVCRSDVWFFISEGCRKGPRPESNLSEPTWKRVKLPV